MNHVMIDCYQGNERRLNDIRSVNNVLNEIVCMLNLKAVMPPFLLPYYYAEEADDDGISAFVLLSGGHITIHTFPWRGCMFVDLLYDDYFDIKKLQVVLERYFLCAQLHSIRTERRFYDTSIARDKIYTGSVNNVDFGPHIITRIENPKNISMENIYDLLDEMPSKINMNPICRPYVLKSSVTNPRYLSGIVLIAQSHIAFHYDSVDNVLFCDLFSCSFYKSEKFAEYLEKRFGKFEYMTIIRGSKHEHNVKNKDIKRRELSKWLENLDVEENENGL